MVELFHLVKDYFHHAEVQDMTSAPDRLRAAMATRKLTIEAFAALLGEKPQRVKDVLRGKQRIPQPMLEAMSREGFDVSFILSGINEKATLKADAIGDASDLLKSAGVPKVLGDALMSGLIDLLSAPERRLAARERRVLEKFKTTDENGKQVIEQMLDALAASAPRNKGAK